MIRATQSPAPKRRLVCKVGDRIPAQYEFWSDSSRVRGYIGGLGAGKTFAGVVEILRQPPRSRGMVIAPTFPMLETVTQQTFFDLTPPAAIHSHNKQKNITVLANGSTIYWRSAEHPRRLRGPNLGWVYVDEAAFISEDAWKVAVGRLRLEPGRAWITTTPSGRANWVYRWFVQDAAVNGYSIHTGKTRDNPYNLSSYALDLETQYQDDPEYARQELDGEFVDLAGSKRIPSGLLSKVFSSSKPLAYAPSVLVKVGKQVHTIPPTARIYVKPTAGRSYVVGVDPAEGLATGDDSAAVVVDKDSGELAAVIAGPYEPKHQLPGIVAATSRHWNGAPVLVERNNHGHATIGGLQRLGVQCLSGGDGRAGWNTSSVSKAQLWTDVHSVVLQSATTLHILLTDLRLKEQIASIDRLTLKAPAKDRKVKVDDEAIAWCLAQQARKVPNIVAARSRAAMARMFNRK